VLYVFGQEQISTSHAGMSSMPHRPTLYAQEGVQPPGYHTRMPTSHRMSGPPYAGHYDNVMVGGGAVLPPGMSPQQHQQMMMSGGWAPEFYRSPGPTSNRMMYPMAVRGPPPAPQNTATTSVPVTANTELIQAESRAMSGQAHQKTDAEDIGDKSEGDQFEDLIGTVFLSYLALTLSGPLFVFIFFRLHNSVFLILILVILVFWWVSILLSRGLSDAY